MTCPASGTNVTEEQPAFISSGECTGSESNDTTVRTLNVP
jgi:hypothetical protein